MSTAPAPTRSAPADGSTTAATNRVDAAGAQQPDDRSTAPGPGARTRRFRKWRRPLAWGIAGVAALVLLVVLLRPTALPVDTATVARGSLEVTVDAQGITRVRDSYEITAPVSGHLERITVRPGDAVAAGMVLARVTPLPLDPQAVAQARARVDAARAGRREAESRVAQTRAALDQAERSTARLRTLASSGALSADAMERAELQLTSTRRDHDAAVARADALASEVVIAGAALYGLDAGARRVVTAIRAPAAGRILRVIEPSERVVAAGAPLIELGDAERLEVVIDVLSTEAVGIQPGYVVRLVDWGGPDTLEARVRLVEPAGFMKVSALGVEEQRVNVIADLADPRGGLGDGYTVQARIVIWSATDVLRIPNGALFRAGNEWRVFVIDDGRARARPVRVGRRGIAGTELLSGVSEGTQLVLFPSGRMESGDRVRPERE